MPEPLTVDQIDKLQYEGFEAVDHLAGEVRQLHQLLVRIRDGANPTDDERAAFQPRAHSGTDSHAGQIIAGAAMQARGNRRG